MLAKIFGEPKLNKVVVNPLLPAAAAAHVPLKTTCQEVSELLIANARDNIILEKIIEGADYDCKDMYGFTPIMYASLRNKLAVVNQLKQVGANLNMQAPDGSTALMIAIKYHAEDAAEALIDAGANVNLKNKMGVTALDFAYGTALFYKLRNSGGVYGNAALEGEMLNPLYQPAIMCKKFLIACNAKDYAAIHKIINQHKEKHFRLHCTDENGKTVLMHAIINKELNNIVPYLIDYMKYYKDETITVAIDLSIVDNNKRSALMYACIYGRENAALLLIESGAQLNTIDNDGKTVLDYAISLESSTLIKALKAKGGKTAVQVSVPQGGRRRKTRRARKTTKRNKTPKRR